MEASLRISNGFREKRPGPEVFHRPGFLEHGERELEVGTTKIRGNRIFNHRLPIRQITATAEESAVAVPEFYPTL